MISQYVGFCNCGYCTGSRCHYWTAGGRKITGLSTPSWCPLSDKLGRRETHRPTAQMRGVSDTATGQGEKTIREI